MTSHQPADQATLEKCLIFGHGFHAKDHKKVLEILHRIDHRLTGLEANQVTLEVMVKDRDHNDQKVTFEGDVGRAHIVATDGSEDLWAAVAEVRDEFLRQYNDWSDKNRR
ncbi:MAG: hypothetical protein H6517_05385 [Microthrixaceae bacterium]|nr:hypothetical protein [Microthrixaceae bacterium]MCB1010835.1 hypothetical protein [Microthrixaceae bacterium]MCB9387241.1 hypothetical protein [Microthrixaceae bacterium]MCO5321918.1 hypothetical protein [Microthrixaceae bacterium]